MVSSIGSNPSSILLGGASAGSSLSGTSLGTTSQVTPSATPQSQLTQLQEQQTAAANLIPGSGTSLPNSGSLLQASVNDASLFPDFSSTQNQLFTQIENTAATRFQTQENTITQTYQLQSNAIQAQINKYISLKAGVFNAKAAVTNSQQSLTDVQSDLLTLQQTLGHLEKPGADVDYWKAQYDSQLSSINQEADRLGMGFNLVGSINPVDWTPQTINYDTGIGTQTTTLQGTYIGSTYRIMANDGTAWIPDGISNTITKYSALQGEPQSTKVTNGSQTISIPTTASTLNGMQLVSYDPNTKAITVNITINPSDPPQTVTGTLQQTGLGVMPSWFYNGFASKSDINAAFKDIAQSDPVTTSAAATLQGDLAQVGDDANHVDQQLTNLNNQTVQAEGVQLKQQQALQVQYQQQVQAMANNLNELSSEQANYLNAFAGFTDDPMLSVLI